MPTFRVPIFALVALFALVSAPAIAEPVKFTAEDGLEITGDVYRPTAPSNAVIVLFHQAGSSRGEYREIAPRLARKGYVALAVDQRSGNTFAGVINETAARAKAQGKAAGYTDALPDLRASIQYAREKLGARRVIIWGSSYSASLALVMAGREPKLVDGVLAFSPGEYFRGKPPVAKSAARIRVPVFITAARSEGKQWAGIFRAIRAKTPKTGFSPKGEGRHGSSALITGRSDAVPEYWTAVDGFLDTHFLISGG
ncbi:MAG: alpha/beta hydrolase [Methyloligellaceae bacterium]